VKNFLSNDINGVKLSTLTMSDLKTQLGISLFRSSIVNKIEEMKVG
jgi:hypothetical protein